MNIGQILETHLGWAASRLGFRAETPVFDGAREDGDRGRAGARLAGRPGLGEGDQARLGLGGQAGALPRPNTRDDDEVRALYLAEWLGERGYDAETVLQRPWLCRGRPSCASGWPKSRRATIRTD